VTYLFGPLLSRRFGVSLGIDLSPDRKRCNFDCLYCELEPAPKVESYDSPPPPEPILEELRVHLPRFPEIDVVTITANGEPTLYPYLPEIVEGVNRLKGDKKSLILSNGSTIGRPEIKESLKRLDIVKLSLDSAIPATFKRLDRPVKGVKLEEIIDGMVQFRGIYGGELIVEVLVVAGINDREEEFRELNRVFKEIRPDRVDISTIDRPPAYRVRPVPPARLYQLAQLIEGVPTFIPVRGGYRPSTPLQLGEEELLTTLKKRPFTSTDVESLFSDETKHLFYRLVAEGKIGSKEVGNIQFFSPI
jgi:wyosine [tRNA(Phe)-imidazoG37] synthetase (radical SAM superfamily)